ncbi:MAG: ABC transporter ATP-binding protein [Rhizobium sp.]|nr:ABC transporter ATP-binding protein [Rhizobium sp.]
MTMLNIENLGVSFWSRNRQVRVLKDVSFSISKGEIVGVLGESGSGKSVTAAAIMGLIEQPPGRIEAGRILFNGVDVLALPREAHRALCGKRLAMIFQDALAALNPVQPVGEQIAELFVIHGLADLPTARARATDLLKQVGIADPAVRGRAYPHQFSGGMRQRVMIAMAIALHPDLIIADEPTTALDVTVQAQIVSLLRSIRDTSGSAIMLITHDLGVVAECADRAVVMYAGTVVEDAPISSLFDAPAHPYTRGLLASRPRIGAETLTLEPIPGTPPDPAYPPTGCAFHPRCSLVGDLCRTTAPALRDFGIGRVACHHAGRTP